MSKTKVCKKCGATMDSAAKACPQCGAPAKGKKGWIIAGVIAAIILIPAIANSGSESSSGSSTAASSSVEATVSTAAVNSEESNAEKDSASADDTKAEVSSSAAESNEEKSESKEEVPNNVYKVGETLDTGKVKITFQSVEDYVSDNMFIEPEEGNKYIRAYFVVENISNSDILVSSYDFDCYADDSVADDPLLSEKLLSGGTISPGRKTEGYVYYEIPANANKVEIEYETSYWTQKKAIFVVK